jgi:hypothetical protein
VHSCDGGSGVVCPAARHAVTWPVRVAEGQRCVWLQGRQHCGHAAGHAVMRRVQLQGGRRRGRAAGGGWQCSCEGARGGSNVAVQPRRVWLGHVARRGMAMGRIWLQSSL